MTNIGSSAFSNCIGLTNVTIPDSVTTIEDNAFSNCIGLTSITIPDSVNSIENSAFYGCTGLANVTIPDSVMSIGDCAFENCTGLTSVIIPNKITNISGGLFENCRGLTSVTIPNSVTSIGYSAFSNCVNLTGVTIPDSVTSINGEAFFNCTSLTNVTIPNSVTSIGYYAFHWCTGLTSVDIPNSLTDISGGAFSGCARLTSVSIHSNVTSIGQYAFSDCMGLTSVTIPDSVTYIGNSAFENCTNLAAVRFLGNAPTMGSNVFSHDSYSFKVYYLGGKTGFTNPWNGYITVSLPLPMPTLSAAPTSLTNGNVTVTISYPDGAKIKEYKIGSGVWMAYTAPVTVYTNGTVYARCADPFGGVSEVNSIVVSNIDEFAPTGSIKINNDNPATKSTAVTLNITAEDSLSGVGYMLISSDSAFSDASWQPYTDTKNWTLTAGEGIKTVYIRFKDNVGNISPVYSDTILLGSMVTGVSLDKTSANLKIGGSLTLTATVSPSDATNKNVTWSSSNTSIAVVDSSGKVNALNPGIVVIMVTTSDGRYEACCIVTVTSNEKPVISGAANRTIKVGDSIDLYEGVTAEDTEDGDLTYKIATAGSVDTTRIGQYPIDYSVTDSDGNRASISILISVIYRNVQVTSLIGSDRYDTAVKLSQSQFSTADTVLIVHGEALADGLGATPLAAFKHAPILLSETNLLPRSTASEIQRLKARNAIIVGGDDIVSDNVKQQMQALGLTVERVSGIDRYATSLEVAKYIDKNCYDVNRIVVSNGYGEADALSIASAAGRDNMPIILVENDNISPAAYEWLRSENIVDAYIIGGSDVVSDNVLNKLDGIISGDIRNNRLGGRDRFDTNALVIDRFYGSVMDKAYIAKGIELIDALAAGPVAAINGSPVVLSESDLNDNQKTVLGRRYGNTIIRTGGGISNTAVNSLVYCLQ